jgi:hypothetical protein
MVDERKMFLNYSKTDIGLSARCAGVTRLESRAGALSLVIARMPENMFDR